jgi:CRP-like cAMP-binding protein
MKKYAPILSGCSLFNGIAGSEMDSLLDCLSARQKKYEKDAYVFMEDDKLTAIGIVLSGALHIVRVDFWGNRVIVERIGSARLFGEAFSCGEIVKLPISVIAAEVSEVLLIDYKKIITTCSSACVFHTRLIRNMVKSLAEKNIMLVKKIEHITQHSTREKLLSYLSSQAQQARSNKFEIPFNRQELAEYLSIDRSAMSAELGRMQDEGLIEFQKNHFEILRKKS